MKLKIQSQLPKEAMEVQKLIAKVTMGMEEHWT
jgi:hypothetical protein